ncbi:MAG: ribosome biogenesis GTP-binding protein YihA/YsxC [Bacteroidota bacterium]
MKIRQVHFVGGAAQWSQMPDTGWPEVAFVGRSNVGKSSLLNALVGRKALARTSSTPGKTQEINYYAVNEAFYLVDLPGFGYAKTSKKQRARWARLITRYLQERNTLACVCHLIDSRHPPTALDQELMTWMKGHPVPYLILLTKVDKGSNNKTKVSKARTERMLSAYGMEVPVLPTSARTRKGCSQVWDWVREVALAGQQK